MKPRRPVPLAVAVAVVVGVLGGTRFITALGEALFGVWGWVLSGPLSLLWGAASGIGFALWVERRARRVAG